MKRAHNTEYRIGTKIIRSKILITESDMNVNVHDEGQTGVKEVAGFVPTEEKVYAVSAIHNIMEVISEF